MGLLGANDSLAFQKLGLVTSWRPRGKNWNLGSGQREQSVSNQKGIEETALCIFSLGILQVCSIGMNI